MTDEQKRVAFARISDAFRAGCPVLPNDFRKWGITSRDEARLFLEEFNESEMREGARWRLSEKPVECRVIDPKTGEERDGSVTGFYGELDFGWRARRAR